MRTDASRMSVEFADRVDAIDDALWQQCFPLPLEGRFWYRTLEGSGLGDQFEFHYALIRSRGEPVGIAPCFVHDVPIALVAPPAMVRVVNLAARWYPRAAYQRTFFIGSPCSDEGTLGLAPGLDPAEALAALIPAVRRKARARRAPVIVFKDFPASALPALRAAGAPFGFFPIASYPGTVAELPPPGKDAYLRALTHNQRHNLLKKLRRSRALLELETSVVPCPSDRELAEIHGLFRQTYLRGKTKFERLGLPFFQSIRGCAPARFITQRDQATGELVGFMLVFDLGGRVINKFIGLDYRRAGQAYLYFRLFDAALDYAYARGARELQSGQTGYRAKLDLGHRLVPLFNLLRHANPLVNAVYRAIGRSVSWRTLDGDLAEYLLAHPGHQSLGRP